MSEGSNGASNGSSKRDPGSDNPQSKPRRDFDIVVWGATGFTGQLVAEYLAEHAPAELRWALAGRNRAKLEKVHATVARGRWSSDDVAMLIADSHDKASLDAMTRRTRTVISTVGPFAKYGSPLVAACVESSTDYCDITGETQWIRRMVDRHHEQAEKSGARIVHCCGFDSIPSDLGCLMLQDHMRQQHGSSCDRIAYYLGKTRGAASGGTVASLINLLEEAKSNRAVLRIVGHPYALNPAGERRGPDGSDQKGVGRSHGIPGYTAPFVMAAINTRIVRRSNALQDYAYGREFRYSEAMRFPASVKGLLMATQVSAGLAGGLMAMAIPPVRSLIQKRFLPKPGEGPSREDRERGCFEVDLIGDGKDAQGRSIRLHGTVAGKRDPGYAETAKMLSESALALAFDDLPQRGGILTPAVALGMSLVERLRAADMTFSVREIEA